MIDSSLCLFSVDRKIVFNRRLILGMQNNSREEKGKEIAQNPNQQIFRINANQYRVKSQTTKGDNKWITLIQNARMM